MARVDGALRLARILDEMRGGRRVPSGLRRAVLAVWPQAPGMITALDRFASAAAKDAVARGVTTVVFGGAGLPFGDHPHAAAARASAGKAQFTYASASAEVAELLCLSFTDGRATACTGSVRAPRGLLRAAGLLSAGGEWHGDGPVHLQWGLEALRMDGGEAAKLAAEYRGLLPSGSELVIAIPDGPEGARFSVLAGGRPHTARELTAWCRTAGLDLAGPVADVRGAVEGSEIAPTLCGGEKGTHSVSTLGGRIVTAVARVP